MAKLLGETPLSLPATQIQPTVGGSGPVWIELKREGFQDQKTLVTDPSTGDLKMEFTLKPFGGLDQPDVMNWALDELFEAQRLVRAGRRADALTKLKAIQIKVPQLSATYEIEGGIYYLDKRYREAVDSLGQALRMNPNNLEAQKLKKLIENSAVGEAPRG